MKQEVIFQVGGYTNQMQAETEARDFSKPEVFRNRSAIFPNPVSHRVQVGTVSAKVKSWPKPPSPFNLYFIEVVVEVTGDEAKIKTWCRRVQQALQINTPAGYGPVGDRTKHLAEMGKGRPGRAPLPAAPKMYPNGMPGDRAAHLAERGILPAKKEGAKT